MPSQHIYTQANRRLHRVYGAHLALRAWRTGNDGVIVSLESLLKALDLKVLQTNRVEQFRSDNRQLFPYSADYRWNGKLVGILLARKPIPKEHSAAASVRVVAANLSKAGLKTAELTLPSERTVIKKLALLSQGLR